jgi:hypothetical protein
MLLLEFNVHYEFASFLNGQTTTVEAVRGGR